jgi:type II secretory pathway component PulF
MKMTGTPRPEYLQSIDRALSHRNEVIALLDAMQQELPSVVRTHHTKNIARRLEGELTAEQLLEDEALASWLPALIQMHRVDSTLGESRWDALYHMLRLESTRKRSLTLVSIYPLAILLAALSILLLLSTTILPTFQKMFDEFGLRTAWPTRVLFALANAMNHTPVLSIVIALTLTAAFYGVIRGMRWVLERLQLSWSIGSLMAGSTGNLEAMSRFMDVLANLLQIRTPIPDALKIAGVASQRWHLKIQSQQLAAEWSSIDSHPVRSRVAHNFPPLLAHALKDDAPCIPLIRALARVYRQRAASRVDSATHWISPIAIFFVGMVVGFTVIAIMMPLVSLVSSLT